jgi:hypothetical protein
MNTADPLTHVGSDVIVPLCARVGTALEACLVARSLIATIEKKVQGHHALFNFAVIEPGTRDSLFTFNQNQLIANNAARELRIHVAVQLLPGLSPGIFTRSKGYLPLVHVSRPRLPHFLARENWTYSRRIVRPERT